MQFSGRELPNPVSWATLRACDNSLMCSSLVSVVKQELGPIEMTPAKLRRALHNHEYVLLNFYAPWCVHCKRFEPVFDKIAKRLHADTELDIVVGKVDGMLA